MGYQSASLPPKNNRMAIVSLTSGIIGWALGVVAPCAGSCLGFLTLGLGTLCIAPLGCLTPIGWLVAIVTGHIAKNQIKQTGEAGDGQASVGLMMGYVGLALLVLLLCIALVVAILAATGTITVKPLDPLQ